jgi:hypothetical protein
MLMIVMLMTILLTAPVSAQMDAPVFCGELAEADCTLVTQSQEAMQAVESAAYDLNLDLNVSGLGKELGVDPLVINMTADGAMAFDTEALAALESASADDIAQIMDNLPQVVADFFSAFKGTMHFEIHVPEALMTADMPDLSFDLIMVDGVFYMDVAPMMDMPEPSWMGIDVAGMYKTMLDMGMDDMGDMGGMDFSSVAGLDIFNNLNDPAYVAKYVTVTRLADAEVMGQTVAVFETVYDYGKLLSDEQFRADFDEYMAAIMEMQGITPDSLGKEYDVMMKFIFSMFDDAEFSMVEWVGLEDHYLHHGELHMSLNLNMEQLKALDPSMAYSDMPDNISLSFDGTLDLSAFNEPVDVAAPEGAQVINPAMFMGNQF